jgi:hypothetical protein
VDGDVVETAIRFTALDLIDQILVNTICNNLGRTFEELAVFLGNVLFDRFVDGGIELFPHAISCEL